MEKQKRVVLLGLTIGIAVISGLVAFSDSSTALASDDNATATQRRGILIGPYVTGVGHLQLEAGISGAPALLRITLRGRGAKDDDVKQLLACWTKVVERKKPFTLIWDARRFFPYLSTSQLALFRAWFDVNYLKWDTYLQQHITIIGNPIARGFASLITRVFRPPAPVYHGRSTEDADEHALRCCLSTRSYVKTREEYDSAPGWGAFT